MGEYTVVSTGTQAAVNSDVYIELLPPSNVSIAIKRIKVTFATATPVDDTCVSNASGTTLFSGLIRATTAGSGGVSFTPVRKSSSNTAAVTTCKVKTGSTTFSAGTLKERVMLISVNTKGAFEWIARDKDDYIWSGENERLEILFFSRVSATNIYNVECDFIE